MFWKLLVKAKVFLFTVTCPVSYLMPSKKRRLNKAVGRLEVIQEIIDRISAKTYIEIGVREGIVFEKVNCDLKIGIDPCPPYKQEFSEKERYVNSESDEFFNGSEPPFILKEGIDVAFIDGLHEYEQVVRDVKHCLKYLNTDGFIVVHDCNPAKEVYSTKGYSYDEARKNAECLGLEWEGPWNGDVWKAIAELRKRDDIQIFVLCCDYGLGIITKSTNNDILQYSIEDIQKMDYKNFDKNRRKILNLKAPRYLDYFIKTNKL